MILTELSSISSAALPFYELKNHLRMGTGFAEDDLQDPLLEAYLRAAISCLESRLGIAILARDFMWQLTAWRDLTVQSLPLRPVSAVVDLTIYDATGAGQTANSDQYRLVQDSQQPQLEATETCLPRIPTGGSAELTLSCGFAADWTDLPPNLAQAVLLLAAHFYEHRSTAPMGETYLPLGVLALIEPYRAIRLGGGR